MPDPLPAQALVDEALRRILALDQTDDSYVDYDGWGNALLRDMTSFSEACNIAAAVNERVGYEALRVTPRKKEVVYTVHHLASVGDGNWYPGGTSTASAEVVCGFDAVCCDAD